MDAVTYPSEKVQDCLERNFVCFTVDVASPGATGLSLVRTFRLEWSPGFVFVDHRLVELRRFVGYRDPAAFLAELNLSRGLLALRQARNAEAASWFQHALDCAPDVETAPEAIYFKAIANYRQAGHDKKVLEEQWEVLGREYSDSRWWQAADVFDVEPTGKR